MTIVHALAMALWMAFTMYWQILWPLILGFTGQPDLLDELEPGTCSHTGGRARELVMDHRDIC